MTPERWQQVKQVLHAALERDPAQQRAFLAAACAGDAALRGEVESLLACQEKEDGDLIERCAIDAARLRRSAQVNTATMTGHHVGSYRVVQELGRGGMGAVYLAERDDEHYQQRVAIKFIKPGLGDDLIRRRFRSETQILADLNHPNIARLLDAGTTADNLPFLVMEYVEGSPINVYCDEHQLSISERLKLFRVVCAAVQYAHQHLVVHRDLKPGNILVTADGTPKLLDFGIAKLLRPDQSTLPTDATAPSLLMMTPEYASPEQIRGTPVTTASDVYSLGVLLYELLSGHRPYRFKNQLPHEVAQAVCEQVPERPSQAIAECGLGNADRKASLLNPQSAIRNSQLLRGDLDNIVLMAMRKEPERRYATVEQLAEDIHRYLEGLPVRARRDTFGYRAGKFVRRHKVGVAAAALVIVTLLIGVVATLWQARVARAERARAERRFNEVRQLANSFVFEVHDAIQNLPGSTGARRIIVQRALQYLDSLAKEAGGDLSLQREMATAYEKLGVVQNTPSVAHLGDLDGAMQSHRKAAALREKLVAADAANVDYRRELLDTYWHIAVLLGLEGALPQKLEMCRQQLAIRETLIAADPANLVDRYNQAGTYTMIGNLLLDMGDIAGALENQRQALAIRETLATIDPIRARARRALTISYEHFGLATDSSGDTQGALKLQRQGLAVRESLLATDPLNTDLRLMLIDSHRYVADLLAKTGDLPGAIKHYREQLTLNQEMVAADPLSTQFRSNWATALIKAGEMKARTGDLTGALLDYRQALRVREELVNASEKDTLNRRDLAEAHIKVGDALTRAGAAAEVFESYGKGVKLLETLVADVPAHVGISSLLADSCAKVGGLHVALALKANFSTPQQVEHWRAARSWYQRSLDVGLKMRGRGIKYQGATVAGLNSPEKIAGEIEKCDHALMKVRAVANTSY